MHTDYYDPHAYSKPLGLNLYFNEFNYYMCFSCQILQISVDENSLIFNVNSLHFNIFFMDFIMHVLKIPAYILVLLRMSLNTFLLNSYWYR